MASVISGCFSISVFDCLSGILVGIISSAGGTKVVLISKALKDLYISPDKFDSVNDALR